MKYNTRITYLVIAGFAMASLAQAESFITYIEVTPETHQSAVGWTGPDIDDFPVDFSTGVGTILDESIPHFGFHSHSYEAPYQPKNAVFTFGFSEGVIVESVTFGQHTNGVTQIEAFVGDSLSSMVSIGTFWGPKGDVISGGGTSLAYEGEQQIFDLSSNSTEGAFIAFKITKTYLKNGYAGYNVTPNFTSVVAIPEPASMAIFSALAVASLGLRRRSR